MKIPISAILWLLLLSTGAASAQQKDPAAYLTDRLPNDSRPDSPASRTYRMTTEYFDHDLDCNLLAKRRLTGTVTYRRDSAQWNNVCYAESKEPGETFAPGEKLDFMQDFRYRPDQKILAPAFFSERLPQADPFIMNMLWDALAFETLAHGNWDSLRLNEPFRAGNIVSELEIAIGTFENRNATITWIGITEAEGKICAVLKYSLMNNPLRVAYEKVSMRGRSHYWGEIYVSLPDRQIQEANLTEDILTVTQIKGREETQTGYTTRSIRLKRIE